MAALNKDSLDATITRLEAITADTKPQWGKMSATDMMCHLRRTFEINLGEVPIEPVKMNPIGKFILKKLFFEGPLPFPKGKAVAPPEFTPEPEEDFEAEKAGAIEYTRKFVEAYEADPKKEYFNALFGMQPMTWWSKLHAKHMDHHLRQFGV